MTLHTRIAVADPVPVVELARFVNRECLHVQREPDNSVNDHGIGNCGNGFGNGFDAAFWIEYRADGPLYPKQTYLAEVDEVDDPALITHEYCADGCTDLHEYNPAMALEINFDTAYGYTSDDGYGCSVLHSLYIVKIGQWLAARGVQWRWYNEYAGEWHDGLEGLTEFVSDGTRANHWFATVVEPAIAASAGAS